MPDSRAVLQSNSYPTWEIEQHGLSHVDANELFKRSHQAPLPDYLAVLYILIRLDDELGLPAAIISDRDPKFVQGFWEQLFTMLKVDSLYSVAYHLQTDGESVRTNLLTEITLRHSG
ncbi:hypothetical protein N7457_002849 [Penicillium paradoxum]|uniref:uncharacterized protein n=1 Tax=Penicillium paradoxum TaxID=176176 RepID=UPI00254737C1|nr:uncharacterized protein N7457_002849 [Penicillium paradoxum]KAJ5787859.1 hypothetical protein N7457_002849 [Penicillium paradoxum]